jgi:hypothetical protein
VRRQPRDERVSYNIEISGWEWDYSFGRPLLLGSGRAQRAFEEDSLIKISGQFRTPKIVAGQAVEVKLYPGAFDLQRPQSTDRPDLAGYMEGPRNGLLVVLFFPARRQTDLLLALSQGKFQRLLLIGSLLQRRKAEIETYFLHRARDYEDE